MSVTNICVVILSAVDLVIGLLLFTGKVKLVITYPEDEQPAPWPQEPKEEKSDNHVKPLEISKPPTLVEVSPKKRRGRPRKEKPQEP